MDKNKHCVILGGGGHASVLIDTLTLVDGVIPYAILDPNPALNGKDLLGVSIVGDDTLLPQLQGQGISYFVVGLGSVGDNLPRRRLFEWGLSCNLKPFNIIHPTAICSRWASIGQGSQLLAGCIINAKAELGVNVIVNSGAIIEHDCRVGDHAHVATGARLASTVQVGQMAHVGAGAVVKQRLIIGEGAIVGAGAVVVRDVPARAVVVGVPARVVRYTVENQAIKTVGEALECD